MGNELYFPGGRYISTYDSRDLNLSLFGPSTSVGTLNPNIEWAFPQESLDQDTTPHCVGFGMAGFGINLPVYTPYTNEAGHKFYYKCKIIDGNPGSEEGSTIRSAAKVLKQEGIINAYAFAYDLATIKWWLLNRGPLLVGTIWTSDMMKPDKDNIIYPTGMRLGGHAYLIRGIENGKFLFQNSWSADWGENGSAYMYESDFEKIFKYDGEAVTAVELENRSVRKPCKFLDVIKNLFT